MSPQCLNCGAELTTAANYCANCGLPASQEVRVLERLHQRESSNSNFSENSLTSPFTATSDRSGSRSALEMWSGLAGVLAGVLIVSAPLLSLLVRKEFILLLAVATLLSAIALVGLRVRHGGLLGRLGRLGIVLAISGMVSFTVYLPFLGLMLTFFQLDDPWENANRSLQLQFVTWAIFSVSLVGILVSGIAMAKASLLPRWASVMFALGPPLGIVLAAVTHPLVSAYFGMFSKAIDTAFVLSIVAGLVIFAAGLIRLGYALWAHAHVIRQLSKQFPLLSQRSQWPRTGFSDKTIWDWLELLIVPIMIAVVTAWFTIQQDARQQAVEDQRAQDTALESYYDKIGQLLVTGNLRDPNVGQEARTLARSRTLTVLERVDSSRKAHVLRFLAEADLVQSVDGKQPVIGLAGADLREATLNGIDLSGANLGNADLSGANLKHANLEDANLRGVSLSGTNLNDANLSYAMFGDSANMKGADLSNANLSYASMDFYAHLTDADLFYTNLTGASLNSAYFRRARLYKTNLSSADLSGASDITINDLEDGTTSLQGTIMPSGQIRPGKYVTNVFNPALSFQLGEGWQAYDAERAEGIVIETSVEDGTGELGRLIITSPKEVFAPSNPAEQKRLPAPKNPSKWAAWFQKHPGLDTSTPEPAMVGEAAGMQIDVTTKASREDLIQGPSWDLCGERCLPLFPGGDHNYVTIGSNVGRTERFVIVNAGDETVVFVISAPAKKFDSFLSKSQNVLKTVGWKGVQASSSRESEEDVSRP